ncbi:MAG: hypothetical protein DSY94_01425, partial [SAR324 cluster bacterium]
MLEGGDDLLRHLDLAGGGDPFPEGHHQSGFEVDVAGHQQGAHTGGPGLLHHGLQAGKALRLTLHQKRHAARGGPQR